MHSQLNNVNNKKEILKTQEIIIRRVLQKPHNGAFVLMHPTKYTVEALPEIIDGQREKGFSICTIGELIKKD